MRTRYLSSLLGLCLFLIPSMSAEPQQTPRCLDAETARRFQREILPELKNLTEKLGIYGRLQKSESIDDILSFSYEIAVTSLDQPLGTWNEDVKNRSIFYTYVLCPIESVGSLFALPEKEEGHVKQMAEARPALVRGAYYRLVIKLSIKRATFQLTPELVRAYKRLPPVEETFDLKILEELARRDR